MSIIYGTLERLEQDEGRSLADIALAPDDGRADRSLKSIAVALVGAAAGIALVLWLGVGEGEGPDRRTTLGPVTVDTALVAEPVAVIVPQAPVPTPELKEITVTTLRLAPREFKADVQEKAPVEAVVTVAPAPAAVTAPAPEPSPAPVAAPSPAPVAQAIAAPAPVVDRIGPVIERARLALSRGSYGLALATLAELEDAPEDRSEFWFIKGSAHLGLGQLAIAEDALSAARALAPMSAQVVVQLSILHQEKGEHARAVAMLEEAAIHHAQVPEIYLNLGYSQLALGDEGRARKSFRTFLELTSDSAIYAQQRVALANWLSQPPAPRVAHNAAR